MFIDFKIKVCSVTIPGLYGVGVRSTRVFGLETIAPRTHLKQLAMSAQNTTRLRAVLTSNPTQYKYTRTLYL